MRLAAFDFLLPHRRPVIAANMLATVDVLSRGRLTVGVGEDIDHFQERGLQHCVIGGDGKDLQGTLELIEQFASEVMAKVRLKGLRNRERQVSQ